MKLVYLLGALIFLNIVFGGFRTLAQDKRLEGVVMERGGTKRVSGATVTNKRSNHSVFTNTLGLFSILATQGDTIEVTHTDYVEQRIVVTSYSDLIVRLSTSNVLREVMVKGESHKEQLQELKNSYKKKGIYYGGKPPLLLLLPIGGSPVTFFYELLSKDGKRARRAGVYAQSESDYYEVSARFNDYNIKRVTPIEDKDLPAFKQAFWPSVEQIRSWQEFDLLKYIKSSYSKFQAQPSAPADSLKK